MRIFLASSRESISDMHKVARWLETFTHEPLTWDEPEAFLPGTYTLDGLMEISREVEAAVFIFGEDDKVWYRTEESLQPRDNVLLEYGLFAGILGRERVLICRKGKARTPSNLEGIVHIDISDGKIESARGRMQAWLTRLDKNRGQLSHPMLAREYVRIVTDNRRILDAEYRERKYSAQYIDIIGMALSGALDELATDESHRMLRRILFDNAQVRLMFLAPTSEYAKQRAIEDGDSVEQLRLRLRGAVQRSVDVYVRLKKLFDNEGLKDKTRMASTGSFEIKMTDFCPHFTIFRTDNSILWGIYTASSMGLYSSVLQVNTSHDALFRQLQDHFNSVWKAPRLTPGADESYLVRFHSHTSPQLNEKLIQEMLSDT
jgi:hypothetical protein